MSDLLQSRFKRFRGRVAGLEQALWEWSRGRPEARFLHSSLGQEAAPFCLAELVGDAPPRLALYYRSHAWLLAFGVGAEEIACAIAKPGAQGSGVSAGPMHLLLRNFVLDCNSIVGAQLPIAVGAAFRARAENGFVVCSLGEGATMTGVFFESLNVASLRRLPVLLVVEDNGRVLDAPSSSLSRAAVGDVFAAFKVPAYAVPGDNVASVRAASAECCKAVRHGPVALHVCSARPGAHAMVFQSRPPLDDLLPDDFDASEAAATRSACLDRLANGGFYVR